MRAKVWRDGVKEQNCTVLLRLAEEGRLLPPFGAEIGIERLVSWMVGAGHMGEVQPFSRVPGIMDDL